MPTDHRQDDPAIADLLQTLYAVISFEEGGEPNWPGLEQVFSRHARITRITPDFGDAGSCVAVGASALFRLRHRTRSRRLPRIPPPSLRKRRFHELPTVLRTALSCPTVADGAMGYSEDAPAPSERSRVRR